MKSTRAHLGGMPAAAAIISIASIAMGQSPSGPSPTGRSSADRPAVELNTELKGPSQSRAELTLWLWALGVNGEVGLRALDVSVDASLLDIMEASDSILALSGRLELGVGKFGGYVDGVYSDLTAEDQTGPVGVPSVDAQFTQVVLDFGAMYRVGEWEPGGDASKSERNMTLDLYAGGRYNDVDVELRPDLLPDRSGSESWLDPIVGAKFVTPLAERWHFAVNGDIGGFGVESEFTWSATAVIGYDFQMWETPASVKFGYRAIGWDFSEGTGADRFKWDVIEHGLLLGLEVRF